MRLPPVTATFLILVFVTRAAQLVIPGWYGALARDPAAPWWRMFTAPFAYDDGWVQFVSIAVGAIVLGWIAERRFGSVVWAVILIVAGLAGQASGLWWQPAGAGSSVAVAGWLGAVGIWLLVPSSRLAPQARLGGVIIIVLGVALVAGRDLHGPPILVGLVLSGLFLITGGRGNEPAQRQG